MTQNVAVLGAGMVGVCCALALQERGFKVTLIDRRAPGEETSYGNAGVVTRSSLIPLNNPSLFKALPRLLRNQQNGLRYDPKFLMANPVWLGRFLANARESVFRETLTTLDTLIKLSQTEHKRLSVQAQATHLWRDTGWLVVYRSLQAYQDAAWARAIYTEFGVAHRILDASELAQLEPALAPIFPRAVWVKDAQSVSDPSAVVKLYAQLFAGRGGRMVQAQACGLRRSEGAWNVVGVDEQSFQHVVVALGPWSCEFLAPQGWRMPMAFERGYHMHYAFTEGKQLQRPVYDTAGGYVVSPMRQGLRLTTGVQLTARDAPANDVQLRLCETAARQALTFGLAVDSKAWLGNRPTMPDSRPVIGPVPGRQGLWCAFGHQHIGFNTGAGTGAMIAKLVTGS
jgi:D-amino-acid dehydrogenase